MPATIFSGSKVKALKKILSLNGGAEIHSGTTDPTSSAVDAPIGTIYQHETTGAIYKKLDAGSSTNWELVGSGAGGDKSYATGNDSTADTALGTKWTTFDDGAYPPVDGGGGTVTATLARTTSSPLQGAGSMLFTPGGQYDAIAFGFTIDRADFARMHRIEFDYEIGTYASYTDGDLKLAVVCASDSGFTTDLQVIQPAGHSILKVAGQETHVATFQSHASNLYYRVCLVQTTASTGYTVKIDNFKIGPQSVAYGAPVTDWQSYTLAVTSTGSAPAKGTNTVDKAMWRRVGDSIEIEWQYVASGAGTAGTGTYLFGLPSGLSIDTTKITADTNSISALVGSGIATFVSGNTYRASLSMNVYNTTNLSARIHPSTSNSTTLDSSTVVGGGSYDLGSSSATYSFAAKVPILGWSSNVVVSDSADTRTVGAFYTGTPPTGTLGAAVNNVTFGTKVTDTHGAYVGDTYTVKVPGLYDISASLLIVGTHALNNADIIYIYKNGAAIGSNYVKAGGAIAFSTPTINMKSYPLNAGDTIVVKSYTDATTPSFGAGADNNFFSISKVGGPAQIAASESVSAKYQTCSTAFTASDATAIFTVKEWDSHGIYNTSTGIITAPVPGVYEVEFQIHASGATTGVVNGQSRLYDGVSGQDIVKVYGQSTGSFVHALSGSGKFRLLAGGTVNPTVALTGGENNWTAAGGANTWITITKVGNY